MSGFWKAIEGDDHVLFFDGDNILKLGKYKQELKDEYQKYIKSKLACGKHPIPNYKYDSSGVFDGQLTSLNWSSYPIECDLLLLGREEWEKGKLKAKIKIEFSSILEDLKDTTIDDNILISENLKYSDLYSIEITVEFLSNHSSSDCEPVNAKVDSALDEIRQKMIESSK
jgi:hypothetical protein